MLKILPDNPTFVQAGLSGYSFALTNPDIEIYLVDSTKGHQSVFISKKCWHTYYVLSGNFIFDVQDKSYQASPGQLVEVPPNLEYCYSGAGKLLSIMNPPWFEGNEVVLRPNPKTINRK